MEIKASDLQVGQTFYGVKAYGEFPEFKKFTALKVTEKQVKGKGTYGYENTLRASDWRYFTDFESARGVWIKEKVEKDISAAERLLERSRELKQSLLNQTDI